MRVFKPLAIAAAFVMAGTSVGMRAQVSRSAPRARSGEIIVKFRHGADDGARGQARAAVAGRLIARIARHAEQRGHGRTELIRVPAEQRIEALLERLRRHPAVEYAEPNFIYGHQAVPNDPLFAYQWALENSGQAVSGTRGRVDADIDATEAWDAAPTGAERVYVGVLDEGIDINHPDFRSGSARTIWTNPFDPADGLDNDGNGYVDDVNGWDFYNGDNSVYDGSAAALDIDSHGTHVAGTIGARRGNGIGVAGLSAEVVIIPTKFLGVNGGSTAGAVEALDYLADLKRRHGLNIVATNNSWTGEGYSQALLEAIANAAREDILFIAASGNGGLDRVADDNDAAGVYPCNYDTSALAGYDAVIAVTATDQSDRLAPYANYGATMVDIAAPGDMIASTTPQNTYSFSSGTSMAAPHVTAAAARASSLFGLSGGSLRDLILGAVDPVSALASRTATGGRLNMARLVSSQGVPPPRAAEVVLDAATASTIVGGWTVRADNTAAGGQRLQSTNSGAAKVAPALATPAHYFELTFTAEAGRPYHLWLRGRAEANGWANDSVHVQFNATVDSRGEAVYRINSSSSAEINLEDCSGCGLSGWGWQDNGYGAGVMGAPIYFAASGQQRMRVQTREDGLGVDQIVLSPTRYLSIAPGPPKNDTTILTTTAPTAAPAREEIALYAADATLVVGGWSRAADSTAAGGIRLQNVNAGAAKVTTALASPSDYFELTFEAEAGRAYRLWLRGKAASNGWANDSVHVQFSSTVSASGAPVYRIGTSSAAEVNLEECSGCGLAGWGWQDNGYGAGALGPELRFATSGLHTLRVQVREDGLGIDQIVLSAARHLTAGPGTPKNDATILPRTR